MSNKENIYKPEEPTNTNICGICLENVVDSFIPFGEKQKCIPRCGHIFCFECMDMYVCVKNKRMCPCCRKIFSNGFIKEIENIKEMELRILTAALKLRKMR